MDLKKIEADYFLYKTIETIALNKKDGIKEKINPTLILLDSKLERNEELILPDTDEAVKINNFLILNKESIYLLAEIYKMIDYEKTVEKFEEIDNKNDYVIRQPLTMTALNKLIIEEFKRIKKQNGLKTTQKAFKELGFEDKIEFIKQYGSVFINTFKDDGYFVMPEKPFIGVARGVRYDEVLKCDYISKDVKKLFNETVNIQIGKNKVSVLAKLKKIIDECSPVINEYKNILENNMSFLKEEGRFVKVYNRTSLQTEKDVNELNFYIEKPDRKKIAEDFNLYKQYVKIYEVSDNPEKIKRTIEVMQNLKKEIRKENEFKKQFEKVL